jgi:hypothetical protein
MQKGHRLHQGQLQQQELTTRRLTIVRWTAAEATSGMPATVGTPTIVLASAGMPTACRDARKSTEANNS